MAKMHRPDFDAFKKESEADRDRGKKYRDCFLWPYINQDDMVKSRPLLLLLDARSRHHPSTFAAADAEQVHLGLVTKAIVPI